MTWDMNDAATLLSTAGGLLTALGGWELVKWLLNRKTEQRKRDAEADNLELETLRRQYDWLQEKYEALNKKVDAMYDTMRELEHANIELERKKSELELALKEAQHNVCLVPDDRCFKREPKRDLCRLRKLLRGEYEKDHPDVIWPDDGPDGGGEEKRKEEQQQ